MTTHAAASPPTGTAIVLAGALSLAVAMGIGRFAFTPMLPFMAREGLLDVSSGGWLAAANYLGYLVGALTAARLPWKATTLGAVAMLATAAVTAAMAWPGMAWWLALRFAAGVTSAWVFVATSVWCLGALTRLGMAHASGWVYAGVGTGMALAGLHCLIAGAAGVPSPMLWLQLGTAALALFGPVFWVLRRLQGVAAPSATTPSPPAPMDGETRALVLCYGLMGFGYILPATFLPAMARTLVDDPRLFGLAWPVFGAMAALSTLLAGWLLRHATRLQVWAVSQALMGVGALLPSLWRNGVTIALSAVLVGGTFMVITLAGVQEARARAPSHAARLVGRFTAAFALGQIAGPVTSALLLQVPTLAAHGLDLALQAGAVALLASAVWLWRITLSTSAKENVHA